MTKIQSQICTGCNILLLDDEGNEEVLGDVLDKDDIGGRYNNKNLSLFDTRCCPYGHSRLLNKSNETDLSFSPKINFGD